MLLATKFLQPAPSPHSVHRERLFERLNARQGKRVSLVVAPAGYGKTTLVAQWCSRLEQPVAWLALDESDDEPQRFWQYVAGALERAGIMSDSTSVQQQIAAAPDASQDTFITLLLNGLAARAQAPAATLVLDDLHLIRRSDILRTLAYLIDYLPPGLHLVILSRTEPALPLARWRVRGWTDELHAADLAFSASECHRFFTDYMGMHLSEEQASQVWRRTEGWAAAMQLAALSGQHTQDSATPLSLLEYSGDSKFISDYVLLEILEQQPQALRDFLLDTACCLRLSAPLCDAMRHSTDSQHYLEQLQQANLFIIPLDVRGEWFRYHDLFREALFNRQRQTQPERLRELQQGAVRWFLAQRQIQEAVSQLMMLEDWRWMAEVLEQHGNNLIHAGHHPQVMRWLASLPPDIVEERPRLQMLNIWALFFGNKHDALEPLLEHLEDMLDRRVADSHPDAGSAIELHSEIALMRSYLARARSDLHSAGALMEQVLRDIDHTNMPLKSVTYYGIGLDGYARGDLAAARSALQAAVDYGKLEKKQATVMSSSGLLAWILFHQGEMDTALALCSDVRAWVDGFHSDPNQPRLVSCWQNASLIQIHREKNQLALAHTYLQPLLNHLEQGTEPGQHIVIQYVRAHLAFSTGAFEEAIAYLEEAEHVLAQKRDVIVFEPPALDALKVRCLMARGDVQRAQSWLETRDEQFYRNPLNREQSAITAARVLVATGHADTAIGLLAPLRLNTEQGQHLKHLIELLCVYAVALDKVGRRNDGIIMLERALQLAARNLFIRVFIEEGRELRALMEAIDPSRLPSTYWTELCAALAQDAPEPIAAHPAETPVRTTGAATTTQALVEPLSQRELEVLALINDGLANKDIAQRLDVAPATIKAHIRNLYGKIGAHSRTSALVRARQLGLLEETL